MSIFIPTLYHKHLHHQDRSLSDTFSILVWNLHKENLHPGFKEYVHQLLQKYPSEILLFQEFRQMKNNRSFFNDYSYVISPNIETKKQIFGVMTAAKAGFFNIEATLSKRKEAGFFTHKSRLYTQHRYKDGKYLTLINMHAINFVSSKHFKSELEPILIDLKESKNAVIICGDFNNWSKSRVKTLESFCKELELKKADVQDTKHIKHIFSKPLDHIFYRGVKLIKAVAIDTKKVSDHNPIYACFANE